jgi:tRNA modification GTPase
MAEAWDALTHAQTARTAAILLDQANGAMDVALKEIASFLQAGNAEAALARIDAILSHARLGLHLTEPWNVVVAGAPNVGKSSLVNALAGYQRSVVAPVPGTTRDVVTAHLAIDGWPVILSDTAGLRDEATGLEQTGIAAARSTLAQADLILWVLDSTDTPVWPDAETVARNPLFVVNKTDQPAAWDIATVANAAFVSAQTGAGVPGLCDAISRRLVPHPPSPGAAIPWAASIVDELRNIRNAIEAGDRKAMEFVLERWRFAQIGTI